MWFKENSVRRGSTRRILEANLKDKFVIGEFVDIEKAEYGASLRELIKKRGG